MHANAPPFPFPLTHPPTHAPTHPPKALNILLDNFPHTFNPLSVLDIDMFTMTEEKLQDQLTKTSECPEARSCHGLSSAMICAMPCALSCAALFSCSALPCHAPALYH